MLCLLVLAFLALSCGLRKTYTAPTNSIKLVWEDNSDNEDGFIIERKVKKEEDFAQIAKVGKNKTTYTDPGLNASTTYYYRVCAYNSIGPSAHSNVAYGKPSSD